MLICNIQASSSGNIDEMLAAGKVSKHQEAKVFKLIKLLERTPSGEPLSSSIRIVSDGITTYVKIPSKRKEEGELRQQQARKRSIWLTWLLKIAGVGAKAVEGAWSRSPEKFDLATPKSGRKMQLGVDASLGLMSSLSLSWTGQRALRTFLRQHNAPIRIATESAIKEKLRTFDVPSEYHELMLDAKNGKVEALVFTTCALGIAARDLDFAASNGLIVLRNIGGESEGNEAAYLMVMQDKGGRSSKVAIRDISRSTPCSFAACSMIGSSEPLHADGVVPEESYKNFKAVLDRISGLQDLRLMKVVQIGQCHVLVPGHCIPAGEWQVEELDAASVAIYVANECRLGPGTEADRAARRAAVPPGSAVLVCFEGKAYGIRAGDTGMRPSWAPTCASSWAISTKSSR